MYRSYADTQADFHPILDVQTQLRNLTQDFATSFNTGNYDQAAALYAPDGILMCPHQEICVGPRAIEHRFRQLSEQGYEDLRCETTRVEFSGDMAVEVGRYTAAIPQGNGTIFADRGSFVHTWRRLGVWRMAAHSWNSSLPVR